MTPEEYPDLTRLLALWSQRRMKFPNWHGFGVSGTNQNPEFTFFVDSQTTDGTPLTEIPDNKIAALTKTPSSNDELSELGTVMAIPRFRQPVSTLTEHIGPVRRAFHKIRRAFSFVLAQVQPIQLQAGGTVMALGNKQCNDGLSGTIAAFLQSETSVWLLSNSHILARQSECLLSGVQIQSDDKITISQRVVSVDLLPSTDSQPNTADAAIAELLTSVSANPSHLHISIQSPTPIHPPTGSTVTKLGPGASVADGVLMFWCPRIEATIESSDVDTTVFKDQMFIGTLPGCPSFVLPGDSGSLVAATSAVDQKISPAGLLFVETPLVSSNGKPTIGVAPFALASPLDSILQSLSAKVGQLEVLI